MELREILDRIDGINMGENPVVTQLRHEEDGEPYRVWRIDTGSGKYILKEAKGKECEIYRSLLSGLGACVPELYQLIPAGEKTYLLMEYIEGGDLCKCSRGKLIAALDALIALQKETWESGEYDLEESFLQRRERGRYLNDPLLEAAYGRFLELYRSLPGALCHDDLLPFNVIVSEERAALIDWEWGGILPYPTSFARLIAHTEEDPEALFSMTQGDKRFAVDYYYDNLLKEKGVSYGDWRSTLEYFLFYEYCEWVFVGNKYHATDGAYYKKYLPLAKAQAAKLLEAEKARKTQPPA